MTAKISAALLPFVLATAASGQYLGTVSPEQAAAKAKAVAALQSAKGSIEAQVAVLDGNVTAGIVLAGDGRLVTLLKESGRLAKALEGGLAWAKEIAVSGPPSRVPFDNICRSLTGKDCGGNGSGEGLLTSLKTEDGRLRDALLRIKAKGGADAPGARIPARAPRRAPPPPGSPRVPRRGWRSSPRRSIPLSRPAASSAERSTPPRPRVRRPARRAKTSPLSPGAPRPSPSSARKR